MVHTNINFCVHLVLQPTDVRLRSLDFLSNPPSFDGSGSLVPMRHDKRENTFFQSTEMQI